MICSFLTNGIFSSFLNLFRLLFRCGTLSTLVLYSALSPLQELDGGDSIAVGGRLGSAGKMRTKACDHNEEEVSTVPLTNDVENNENKQYCCPFCQHTAARLSLPQHLQESHSENVLTCNKCSLKFIDLESFESHQLTHINGDRPCEHCDVRFGTATELSNHKYTKHALKECEESHCPVCKKVFRVRSKFVTHVIKLHRGKVTVEGLVWGDRGSVVCGVCRKVFKKAALYVAHEKVHRGRTLGCLYCENAFSSQNHLQDHILTHLFGDYECNDCGVKFVSPLQLGAHEEKVHKANPSKQCEYCHKEFRDPVRLICHMRKEHPESEESIRAKYSCGECGMKFVMRGNFVRHMRVHEKEKDVKPRACGVCGKVLANKYSLATHMRTHSTETSNKCDICDKAFVSKYTLTDHVRRIHEEHGPGRDKVCDICGRSFFTKTELKYHIKSHTGERPYRCDVCGETYLSSSTLRYHMQKHSNVMFVCPKCKAKFENYVGWSTHMKRVHGVSRVKDYTRQHGLLQVIVNKEIPSLFICSDGQNGEMGSSLSNLMKKNCEDTSSLSLGLEETVESVPEKKSSAIQLVTYNDVTNPLIHTVDATEVEPGHSSHEEANMSQPNLPSETGLGRNHISPMIEEEWEIILPDGTVDTSVISEEWAGSRLTASHGGAQQLVLTEEWDGTQLIISEEGEEPQAGMAAWKGADY